MEEITRPCTTTMTDNKFITFKLGGEVRNYRRLRECLYCSMKMKSSSSSLDLIRLATKMAPICFNPIYTPRWWVDGGYSDKQFTTLRHNCLVLVGKFLSLSRDSHNTYVQMKPLTPFLCFNDHHYVSCPSFTIYSASLLVLTITFMTFVLFCVMPACDVLKFLWQMSYRENVTGHAIFCVLRRRHLSLVDVERL